ncbi:hypothetical protein [Cognatilysobacter bugurensis]|uniref:TonB C-terminal domain-containing protein n=1 Tax=Cognatilysobacter bugurensis TaxID=543356 RepID=A0A918SU04_9GAMM|nr:hypothetical protein [Lysobacter bugurensis]GHA68782.1 hypothetical protein GCM10007067_00820 [Lysobacter bugurensis]
MTSRPFFLPLAVAAVAAVIGGCASRQPVATAPAEVRDGRVGAEDITHADVGQPRLALASNEAFHEALPEPSNALPAYPGALLAQQLPPQTVCVHVAVDGDGRVMFARPLRDRAGCTAAADAAFDAAAVEAVNAWRFDPAFKCVFADEATKRRDGPGCADTLAVRQPVSLVYRFEFRQENGRGAVAIDASAAP